MLGKGTYSQYENLDFENFLGEHAKPKHSPYRCASLKFLGPILTPLNKIFDTRPKCFMRNSVHPAATVIEDLQKYLNNLGTNK